MLIHNLIKDWHFIITSLLSHTNSCNDFVNTKLLFNLHVCIQKKWIIMNFVFLTLIINFNIATETSFTRFLPALTTVHHTAIQTFMSESFSFDFVIANNTFPFDHSTDQQVDQIFWQKRVILICLLDICFTIQLLLLDHLLDFVSHINQETNSLL